MAIYTVAAFNINSVNPGVGAPFVVGRQLFVYNDTVLGTIYVKVFQSPSTYFDIGVSDPHPQLNSAGGIGVSDYGASNYGQHCEGSGMVTYNYTPHFPYATRTITADHPSCAVLVCDLLITSSATTPENGVGTEDGTITVTATGTNGEIRYSLTPGFSFYSGQTSGLFEDLPSGDYTIYAQDVSGCTDNVSVFVALVKAYGPRWRFEYDRFLPTGKKTKVEIWQEGYDGAVEEVAEGGGSPVIFESVDESVLKSISALITFKADYENQYIEIRTMHDQAHLARISHMGVSGWEEILVGYVLAEFYEEPYLGEPYDVTFKAVDGLVDFAEKLFLREGDTVFTGNVSLLDMIAEYLKYFPFQLPVNICINIYEANHDDGIDPLSQTYVDSYGFRDKSYREVIESILAPLCGGRIFQANGEFWITTKEQCVDDEITYHRYTWSNKVLVYDSTGTIEPVRPLGKNLENYFINKSQVKSYLRSSGKVIVRHDMGKFNNMFLGNFLKSDIDKTTLPEYFRGWQFAQGESGVRTGWENVKDDDDDDGAFFIEYGETTGTAIENVLQSTPSIIKLDSQFAFSPVFATQVNFRLKFRVKFIGKNAPWFRLRWSLSFYNEGNSTTYYYYKPGAEYGLLPVGLPTETIVINEEYVTSNNAWQDIEYSFFSSSFLDVNQAFRITFYFSDQKPDVQFFSGLRDLVVTDRDDGTKRYVAGADGNTYRYVLSMTTAAESEPSIIRPDNYHAVNNPYQWTMEGVHQGTKKLVTRMLLDDVQLSIYPTYWDPATSINNKLDPPQYNNYVGSVNEKNVKEELVTLLFGDAPIQYPNPEYIYIGIYKLSDGTPTKYWGRQTVPDESDQLLNIYLLFLLALNTFREIITCTIASQTTLTFLNAIIDVSNNKKFTFRRFRFDDKWNKYDVELEEINTGEGGNSPVLLGEFSDDFNEDFYI